jgi:alanyl-tRNA synthetase
MRIVAEHARASTFLIADGVTPSNEGRSYVLRRLIRRGTSFGQRLKQGGQFLERTAEAVIEVMGGVYENLLQQRDFVLRTLRSEESRFADTVTRGEEILRGMLKSRLRHRGAIPAVVDFVRRRQTSADNAAAILDQYGFTSFDPESTAPERIGEELATETVSQALFLALEAAEEGHELSTTEFEAWPTTITARELIYLYDTHGFPPELTRELLSEEGFTVADPETFEVLMEEQRARSRASARFEGDGERIQTYAELGLQPTEFLGYETTRAFATVASIILDGTSVVRELTHEAAEGHRVELALTQSPFYPEGGGQVGDRGEITWQGGRFVVEDTRAVGEGGVIAHIGRLEQGTLATAGAVEARVDEELRADTMRNHTATHILHAALRSVLGTHVRQAGSLVAPDRLRFDFTHLEAMTPQQIRDVEALANKVMRENISVHVEHQTYEEAIESGALAFFGDKYADTVRVVGVCDPEAEKCFSRELCGGTHVHSSGEVGAIVITGETSIGAGLRRLEAVTGAAAAERLRSHEDTLARLSAALNAPASEVETRVTALREENDRLRRQIQTLERRLARDEATALADNATQIDGISVLVSRTGDVASADALREMGDGLKARLGSAVILLGSVIGGRPSFVAMSTPDVASRCPAGDVVRATAQVAGGNGGGRPELAQGGGSDPSKLDAALAAGRRVIEEKLQPHA